jgi:hypothetical protein
MSKIYSRNIVCSECYEFYKQNPPIQQTIDLESSNYEDVAFCAVCDNNSGEFPGLFFYEVEQDELSRMKQLDDEAKARWMKSAQGYWAKQEIEAKLSQSNNHSNLLAKF